MRLRSRYLLERLLRLHLRAGGCIHVLICHHLHRIAEPFVSLLNFGQHMTEIVQADYEARVGRRQKLTLLLNSDNLGKR